MPRLAHLRLAFLLGLAVLVVLPDAARAQRPFQFYDPFYRGETARRAFYDGYAVTAEVSYRPAGSLQDGRQTFTRDWLGLAFQLNYQLLPQIDLAGYVDAAASDAGRSLTLSWVALKYYNTVENTDYAFRLAVDPSLDGRVGFPQMDAAFISTTLLSPSLSSDYALGMRRIRKGYQQIVLSPDGEAEVPRPYVGSEVLFTRAMGWEVHFMMQYAYLLGAARSNVFGSLLFHGGEYELLETSLSDPAPATSPASLTGDAPPETDAPEDDGAVGYRGGVVWLRTGVEYNRPAYQVLPFVSVPLKQWIPAFDDDRQNPPAARISAGFRFTLR